MFQAPFTTLVDVEALQANIDHPHWVILDARFNLADVDAGRRAYLDAHIPGAAYVDLDQDLSGPPLTDRGRHSLPSPEAMAALFGRLYVGSWSEWCSDPARPIATGPTP